MTTVSVTEGSRADRSPSRGFGGIPLRQRVPALPEVRLAETLREGNEVFLQAAGVPAWGATDPARARAHPRGVRRDEAAAVGADLVDEPDVFVHGRVGDLRVVTLRARGRRRARGRQSAFPLTNSVFAPYVGLPTFVTGSMYATSPPAMTPSETSPAATSPATISPDVIAPSTGSP